MARPQQPQIAADDALLLAGHRVARGMALDLYGECHTDDCPGYEVRDVALAGTRDSLYELVAETGLLERLTDWCNANLPSAAQLLAESRAQTRIEHAEWERDFHALE